MKVKRSPLMATSDVERQTRIIVPWWVVSQIFLALVVLAHFGGLFAVASSG